MFNSKIHDPKAAWRADPASDAQKVALKELGFRVSTALTKGEAADLISAESDPDDDEIEFLSIFGVRDAASLNQLEARRAIARIVADPEDQKRWEERPASKEQRDLIRHVEGSVPASLTMTDAETIIGGFDKDDAKSAKADAFREQQAADENRRYEREDTLGMIRDGINDDPGYHELKRVSMRDVKRAVEAIEAETGEDVVRLSEVSSFDEQVAARIRQMNPAKEIKVRTRKARARTSAGSGWVVWVALGALLLWWFGR